MKPILVGSILALLVFTVVLIEVISNRKNRKKLRDKIEKQFRNAPEQADDVEFGSISIPWNEMKKGKNSSEIIDHTTWNDLDMNEVFNRMNACQTSIGEEYLYALLHGLKFAQDGFDKQEKLVDYLKSNPETRLNIQMCLSKLGKSNYNGLYSFLDEVDFKSVKFSILYKILSYLPLCCFILIPISITAAISSFLCAIVMNILVYFIAKKPIEYEDAAVKYFSTMLWCCNQICTMEDRGLSELQMELKENYRYMKSISGDFSGTVQKKIAMSDIDMFLEYFKIISLYDIKKYNKIIRTVSKYKENCKMLYRSISELDAWIAILSFRESLPVYTKPHFISSMQINLKDLYHPLLKHPVPNTVLLSNDSIITGSNASGKSTFIKALAINGILAQTINTCTARVYQTPYALIITSMAVRDNIMEGDSYFVTELKSLKRVLDKVENTPCICFVDEILKGTNTVERIAASASILKYLHQKNCLVTVASHDIELTRILEEEYDNYNFCEQITDEGITFDYTIKEGASQTRNAIKLLHFMEFGDEIVGGAENLANQFITTKKW
jgi:hypothetical protein